MAEQMSENKVPKRILNTLLTALSAGVVPRIGAPYIAIGRKEEISSLLDNFEDVSEGGATCRFLIGRYGSGKSFLIQLLRGYALERDFLCADADLTPERRLCGANGAGVATYRELMTNLASKTSPDGGALASVFSRHFIKMKNELTAQGCMPDSPEFNIELQKKIYKTVSYLEEDVGGFDFAQVLSHYYLASIEDNAEVKSACLRWFRGEYVTKTEAKNALGFSVSTIINDDNWYNFIKLFATLCAQFGYRGLILYIDECVNLYKIPNRISREANYEKILSIFNDTLQGKAKHLGVIFGGTPQFLEDTRRGLFSYDALKSRLADSRYAVAGYQNLSSPVIRLRRLSDNELLALVSRLNKLYAQREGREVPLLTEEQVLSFVKTALSRAGAHELVTPREIIRDFLTLLNILRDNPEASFDGIVKELTFGQEDGAKEEVLEREQTPAPPKKISVFDIEL